MVIRPRKPATCSVRKVTFVELLSVSDAGSGALGAAAEGWPTAKAVAPAIGCPSSLTTRQLSK